MNFAGVTLGEAITIVSALVMCAVTWASAHQRLVEAEKKLESMDKISERVAVVETLMKTQVKQLEALNQNLLWARSGRGPFGHSESDE